MEPALLWLSPQRVTMPLARLVRWSELTLDHPLPKVNRQRVIGERMMVSRVFFRAGCVVPIHHHVNEQITLVLSGRVRFVIQDDEGTREHLVEPGEVLCLPSNVPHSAEALEDSMVLDLFSPPSETTGIDLPILKT